MQSRRYKLNWHVGFIAVGAITALSAAAWAWSWRERAELVAGAATGGDPARAPELIRRYGCAGCHTIPGISGADGQVGPPLAGLRQRVFVGGVAENSADHLIQWIVTPQKFSPGSAMPATGISQSEARDIAAYLYAR
jgi:cytochrome c